VGAVLIDVELIDQIIEATMSDIYTDAPESTEAVNEVGRLIEKLRGQRFDRRRPQVVANISGGVLQGASSDYPVDLYTLDFDDVPDDDPENVIEVEGSRAYLGQTSTKIDPDFVRQVIEAPTEADNAEEADA
jgi:hypothetical protein